MRLTKHSHENGRRKNPGSENGTAILFVMVLLAAMGILLLGNAVVLRSLTREIQLVDQEQKTRILKQAPAPTNAPVRLSPP